MNFNPLSINMDTARKALTETEFEILATLFNKVEDYRIEQMIIETQKQSIDELLTNLFGPKGNIPFFFNGTLGAGKTSSMKEMAEQLGFKVVQVTSPKFDIQKMFEEEVAAKEDLKLLTEIFGNVILDGEYEMKSQHAMIEEQIIRLKNQGYSDQLISHTLHKAFLSGKDVVEYLKVLE